MTPYGQSVSEVKVTRLHSKLNSEKVLCCSLCWGGDLKFWNNINLNIGFV